MSYYRVDVSVGIAVRSGMLEEEWSKKKVTGLCDREARRKEKERGKKHSNWEVKENIKRIQEADPNVTNVSESIPHAWREKKKCLHFPTNKIPVKIQS